METVSDTHTHTSQSCGGVISGVKVLADGICMKCLELQDLENQAANFKTAEVSLVVSTYLHKLS